MKKLFSILCVLLLFPLFSHAEDAFLVRDEQSGDALIEEVISGMTLEEKVSQLFFVRPEDVSRLESVTEYTEKLGRGLEKFPVGGLIFFSDNLKTETQTAKLTAAIAEKSEEQGILPFLGIDEEGGGVSRAASKFGYESTPAYAIGETGDPDQAEHAGKRIGAYLHALGFNLDFAPVADVRCDVPRPEITLRSFGTDAETVSGMVSAFVKGLQSENVLSVLKHFPGHGSASGNSHNEPAVSKRTPDEWRACDWLPFRAGINAGARFVLMSHLTAPNAGIDEPASLSSRIVTDYLRGELGFTGVVITDALRMKAVSDRYGSGEACVRALEAGCDMLLLPYNFTNAYNGVLSAVSSGRITEERLDESLKRILSVKLDAGLIRQE